MTLEEFLRKFERKVRRDRSQWVVHEHTGSLRSRTVGAWGGDCPLTYLTKMADSTVGTCAERLGLRLATARRIADAADAGNSSDGLRTRLLRAAHVREAE